MAGGGEITIRSMRRRNKSWRITSPARPRPDFVKAYMHNGYFKSLKEVVHFSRCSRHAAEMRYGVAAREFYVGLIRKSPPT